MKLFSLLGIVVFVLGAGLTGCQKDEDVAELERQVMEQQGRIDTMTDPAPDTVAPTVAPPPQDAAAPPLSAGAIPEEPASSDLPPRPAGSGYAVQIAGCEDPNHATFLVDKYRQRGYEPFVTTEMVGGQTYHRVRVGIFDTFGEARRVKNELRDKYSIEPWIDAVM